MKFSLKSALALGSLASVATFYACKTPQNSSKALDDETGSTGDVATGDFATYCTGTTDVADPVVPNYANADVKQAAQILSMVKSKSFKLYWDMMQMHLTTPPTDSGVTGLTKDAHNFLTYLCGEFRDKPSMIKTKIDWVKNMRYLNNGEAQSHLSCASLNDPLKASMTAANETLPAFDRTKSPWEQMCIEDYEPYVELSDSVFSYREDQLKAPGGQFEYDTGMSPTGRMKIHNRGNIDRHVPGYTVCETKYIFSRYLKVKPRKTFTASAAGYKDYMDGYKAFKADCTTDDLGWYYDFRGDSNFKPNSPEGNGMIWMGKVAAAMCTKAGTEGARVKALPGMAMTDADCRHYYENPFKSRYGAARAGLAAWLGHDTSVEAQFANAAGAYYTIANHYHKQQNDVFSGSGPFLARLGDKFGAGGQGKLTAVGTPAKFFAGLDENFAKPDFGVVEMSGKTGEEAKQFLFERIQRAVDRHTNWYKSGYDRAPGLPLDHPARHTLNQAYSPFVASSYEMSKSNGFTQCGVTIPCAGVPEFDQHKQWMFIFKVRKENWFRPEDIAAGNLTPDLAKVWFDETAFGDDGLANEERAWDRLGTPTEEEHAEILYLWRIPSGN